MLGGPQQAETYLSLSCIQWIWFYNFKYFFIFLRSDKNNLLITFFATYSGQVKDYVPVKYINFYWARGCFSFFFVVFCSFFCVRIRMWSFIIEFLFSFYRRTCQELLAVTFFIVVVFTEEPILFPQISIWSLLPEGLKLSLCIYCTQVYESSKSKHSSWEEKT